MLTRRDLYGKGGSIIPIPNNQAMKDENPSEAAIAEGNAKISQMKREANETKTEETLNSPPIDTSSVEVEVPLIGGFNFTTTIITDDLYF